MQVVYSPDQAKHHAKQYLRAGTPQPCPEQPERAERLLAGVKKGGHSLLAPPDCGLGPIARVHSADYLTFLQTIHARWQELPGASAEVVPNIHPQRYRPASYPRAAVGQAGFHMADTACPIGAGTWEGVKAAAATAVQAGRLLRQGARVAYALCRPPGHHAYRDMAGGFCFLNNSAIVAEDLRAQGMERVCILDVDVHHGNGTQAIFYDRPDILTVSLHGDPADYYPFFWGHAHERGEGAGAGANLNLPLARGTDTAGYLAALEAAFARIEAFAPDGLVVALGLDAFEGDPLAFLAVTTEGFAEIARAIAGLDLPTVLVQEGGYLCPELGDNLASFLAGYEAGLPV